MSRNFFDDEDDGGFDLPDGGDAGTPEASPEQSEKPKIQRPGMTRPGSSTSTTGELPKRPSMTRPGSSAVTTGTDTGEEERKRIREEERKRIREEERAKMERERAEREREQERNRIREEERAKMERERAERASKETASANVSSPLRKDAPPISNDSSDYSNPFAHDEDVVAHPEEHSFMEEMKPEDLSPQVDIEEEERKERQDNLKKKLRLKKRNDRDKEIPVAKKSKKKQGKKSKFADDEEEFTRFSGKRKRVFYGMLIGIIIIAILCAGGIKQFFFPAQIPSPDMVTQTVSERLGVTKFPEEEGNAQVVSFVNEYLTVNPKTIGDKAKRLGNYTSESIAASLTTSGSDGSKMSVTAGPYISGVESIDDTRAKYTVAAQLNGSRWVYLEVPMYYDHDANAFSVYQAPSFVAKPQVANIPSLEAPFESDDELAETIKSDQTAFFKAWGSSDPENLKRYLMNDASIEARTGLQGTMKFVSLDSLLVEAAPKDVDPATVPERKAIASITWADPKDSNMTYTQSYDMKLYQQPDGRWYVEDITGSVNSRSQ